MKKIILLLSGLAVVIIIISISITDRETFYSTMGGAAIGFLVKGDALKILSWQHIRVISGT